MVHSHCFLVVVLHFISLYYPLFADKISWIYLVLNSLIWHRSCQVSLKAYLLRQALHCVNGTVNIENSICELNVTTVWFSMLEHTCTGCCLSPGVSISNSLVRERGGFGCHWEVIPFVTVGFRPGACLTAASAHHMVVYSCLWPAGRKLMVSLFLPWYVPLHVRDCLGKPYFRLLSRRYRLKWCWQSILAFRNSWLFISCQSPQGTLVCSVWANMDADAPNAGFGSSAKVISIVRPRRPMNSSTQIRLYIV